MPWSVFFNLTNRSWHGFANNTKKIKEKNMFNKSKKGFTLVELLVVIAILAILTTVSIVGYTTFIAKAQLSNDQAFITQANLTLQAAAIPNPFQSASQAINELNRNGFAGKYNTYSSGFHYAYSLENNKMYLIDDHNAIIFPEEQVELSTLWGLYNDNRTSYVDGITKYVAMANITNEEHFNEVFASGAHTIDLNGCFIDVDATNAQITASNGIVISGATAGEGVDAGYVRAEGAGSNNQFDAAELVALDDVAGGEVVIKDKIFTQFINAYIREDVKFVNCVFYGEASVQIGGGSTELVLVEPHGDVTFEDCQFINMTRSWAITLNSNTKISVKDCTFTGLQSRGVMNANPYVEDVEIEFLGCTFDGTANEYALVRFVTASGNIKSFAMKDCTFLGLGKAASILGYRTADTTVTASTTWSFSNNKVASSITTDMYVQGWDSGNSAVYDEFVAGIK